ncbi:hypothetical protein EDD18DRAFT_1353723 [Armillaria luteobubalina]|uniref:Uncharacterized protein n=1 Tax=Armillaria luteobubalina TaxID=153913 RepID=A0AA39Q4H4_9AGAR|nr:hypothetical protein EDD18DRAFT_1353723 [Armillaria luteobubalina]
MATQTDIPPDLTNDDKVYIFQFNDAQLNSGILYALLLGIYTGIFAVSLWNISINKCRPTRRATTVIIILLHALITMSFAANWQYLYSAFIDNGSNFWTVFLKLTGAKEAVIWETGVPAFISTILADLYLTWCCWIVWGRRCHVVLLPILSLVSATVSKIVEMYRRYINAPAIGLDMFYISFTLATTLSCTLLIIYRIVTIVRVGHRAGVRLRVYRHFIEVFIEPSALYSVSLILYLAFTICDSFALYYLDAIAAITKGVAPTLLIGRIAAGHTRPQDESNGNATNTMSSLHFQVASEGVGTTSFQGSIAESVALEADIEAQHEQYEEVMIVAVERT